MAISYVGSASAASTSVALPAHQVGDLIVFCAFALSTLPTTPSGWSRVGSVSFGNRRFVVAYKHAATIAEVSGTWTDALMVACAVYRSDLSKYIVPGFHGLSGNLSATSLLYLGNNSSGGLKTDGNGWMVAICGTSIDTTADTVPSASFTLRTSVLNTGELALHDTNGSASVGNLTVACSATAYQNCTLEIYESNIDIPSGGGVPLIGTGGLVY